MKLHRILLSLFIAAAFLLIGFTYYPNLLRTSYSNDEIQTIYKTIEETFTQVAVDHVMSADVFSKMITIDDLKNGTQEEDIYQRAIQLINTTLDEKQLSLESNKIQEIADVVVKIYHKSTINIEVISIKQIRIGLSLFILSFISIFVIWELGILVYHNKTDR